MALWGAVLGHGNLVYHAAGWQEGGLTASFEKFIIDVEMIQHMMEFLRPIEVNEGELALDALGRVPTGGHFFGEPHTLERYSTAFYQPMLSNWQNYEAWQEAGGLDATARATRLWKKALEEYVEPAMDVAVREELEAYVAKRKEEIGAASREVGSRRTSRTLSCAVAHLSPLGGETRFANRASIANSRFASCGAGQPCAEDCVTLVYCGPDLIQLLPSGFPSLQPTETREKI